MFDKIIIITPETLASSAINKLKKRSYKHFEDTNITYHNGKLDNLEICWTDNKVIIENSMNKYIKGNNYESYNYQDFEDAIEKLKNELGLKLDDAEVSYLEFGYCLYMDYDASDYFNSINFHELKSGFCNSTINIEKGNTTTTLYDKGKEVKKRNGNKKLGNNVLRFEIKKKLKKHIPLSNLFETKYIKELLNEWRDSVNNIPFERKLISLKEIASMGNFDSDDFLITFALNCLNNEALSVLYKMMKDKYPKDSYYRRKNKYERLRKSDYTLLEEKAQEFCNKVKEKVNEELKQYCLYNEANPNLYKMMKDELPTDSYYRRINNNESFLKSDYTLLGEKAQEFYNKVNKKANEELKQLSGIRKSTPKQIKPFRKRYKQRRNIFVIKTNNNLESIEITNNGGNLSTVKFFNNKNPHVRKNFSSAQRRRFNKNKL